MKPTVRLIGVLTLFGAGCAGVGPSALHQSRLQYNETVKVSSEEEMLLNIVRLRYTDTPSSLAVSSIAAQFELAATAGVTPFFVAGTERTFASVLPQANFGGADRPTFSLTPLDDSEFARRLFTPLSLEGAIYLAKTTWPIQTVFRLYLENLNWVANAETASGPTPAQAPPSSRFLEGMRALQALQQRGDIVFGTLDRKEPTGATVATITAEDAIAAVRDGLEFVEQPGGRGWRLQRVVRRFVLFVNPAAFDSPELQSLQRAFRLKGRLPSYELTVEGLGPYVDPGQEGFSQLDLETRSLLQALYFVSHGVQVPTEHLERRLARQTLRADGSPYDWSPVLEGLFAVKSEPGGCGGKPAHVAVPYHGHCFFIDQADHDTKSTFALLMELARLQFPGNAGHAPMLTIPIGR